MGGCVSTKGVHEPHHDANMKKRRGSASAWTENGKKPNSGVQLPGADTGDHDDNDDKRRGFFRRRKAKRRDKTGPKTKRIRKNQISPVLQAQTAAAAIDAEVHALSPLAGDRCTQVEGTDMNKARAKRTVQEILHANNHRSNSSRVMDAYGNLNTGDSQLSMAYLTAMSAAENKLAELWAPLIASGHLFELCSHKSSRVREGMVSLAVAGIPIDYRGHVWMQTSGAAQLKAAHSTDFYQKLQLHRTADQRQIEVDVPRTFPSRLFFQRKEGRGALKRVLRGVSIARMKTGYCQEEDAFWLMMALMHRYSWERFYRNRLVGLSKILHELDLQVRKRHKKLAKSFAEIQLSPLMYGQPYFLTLFTYNMSIMNAARVWDVLFCLHRPTIKPTKLLDCYDYQRALNKAVGAFEKARSGSGHVTSSACQHTLPAASDANKHCIIVQTRHHQTFYRKDMAHWIRDTPELPACAGDAVSRVDRSHPLATALPEIVDNEAHVPINTLRRRIQPHSSNSLGLQTASQLLSGSHSQLASAPPVPGSVHTSGHTSGHVHSHLEQMMSALDQEDKQAEIKLDLSVLPPIDGTEQLVLRITLAYMRQFRDHLQGDLHDIIQYLHNLDDLLDQNPSFTLTTLLQDAFGLKMPSFMPPDNTDT